MRFGKGDFERLISMLPELVNCKIFWALLMICDYSLLSFEAINAEILKDCAGNVGFALVVEHWEL